MCMWGLFLEQTVGYKQNTLIVVGNHVEVFTNKGGGNSFIFFHFNINYIPFTLMFFMCFIL